MSTLESSFKKITYRCEKKLKITLPMCTQGSEWQSVAIVAIVFHQQCGKKNVTAGCEPLDADSPSRGYTVPKLLIVYRIPLLQGRYRKWYRHCNLRPPLRVNPPVKCQSSSGKKIKWNQDRKSGGQIENTNERNKGSKRWEGEKVEQKRSEKQEKNVAGWNFRNVFS